VLRVAAEDIAIVDPDVVSVRSKSGARREVPRA
jgi:hypothetical protein